MAYRFGNVTTDFVGLGDITTARFQELEAWSYLTVVKCINNTNGDQQGFLSKWGAGGVRQIRIRFNTTDPNTIRIEQNGLSTMTTGAVIDESTWYLFALCCDGTGATGNLTYYIFDMAGDLVETGTDEHDGDDTDLTQDVYLGKSRSGSEPLNGDLSFTAYFSEYFEEQEVKFFLEHPLQFLGTYQASCEYFLPMNDIDGANDLSGNGNHGTLNGSLAYAENPPILFAPYTDFNDYTAEEITELTLSLTESPVTVNSLDVAHSSAELTISPETAVLTVASVDIAITKGAELSLALTNSNITVFSVDFSAIKDSDLVVVIETALSTVVANDTGFTMAGVVLSLIEANLTTIANNIIINNASDIQLAIEQSDVNIVSNSLNLNLGAELSLALLTSLVSVVSFDFTGILGSGSLMDVETVGVNAVSNDLTIAMGLEITLNIEQADLTVVSNSVAFTILLPDTLALEQSDVSIVCLNTGLQSSDNIISITESIINIVSPDTPLVKQGRFPFGLGVASSSVVANDTTLNLALGATFDVGLADVQTVSLNTGLDLGTLTLLGELVTVSTTATDVLFYFTILNAPVYIQTANYELIKITSDDTELIKLDLETLEKILIAIRTEGIEA